MRCAYPCCRKSQFICEAVLLVPAHLIRGYARQAVVLIERGEAILVRFQSCRPMAREESVVAGYSFVFGKYPEKIEGYVDMDKEEWIVPRPIQETRTLRDLVPHHSVFR